MRLATLPNSAWVSTQAGDSQDGDSQDGDPPDSVSEARLSFSTDAVRWSEGELSKLYRCGTGVEGDPTDRTERLRCSSSLDVEGWCRARLANRLPCDVTALASLGPTALAVGDEAARAAVVRAAEAHAMVAGTEFEGGFVERYAQPETPLLQQLNIELDAARCMLHTQRVEVMLEDGEWAPRTEEPRAYVPAPPP